jgi:hypothetical protein
MRATQGLVPLTDENPGAVLSSVNVPSKRHVPPFASQHGTRFCPPAHVVLNAGQRSAERPWRLSAGASCLLLYSAAVRVT